MKTKLALASLLLATALTPMIGYAADSDTDRSHPMTFVKDSAITTEIKAKLAAEHVASLARIHVDTDANGAVVLSGSASGQAEIDKTVSIARGTEHVTSVTNHLQIKRFE